MHTVEITSAGTSHGALPPAHLTVDLREHFPAPHASPKPREMTAADPRVRMAVIGTPGVVQLVGAATAAVMAYLSGPSATTVTVVTACAGGRRRAPVVADLLAAALAERGVSATVTHRDLHRPVVHRPVPNARAAAREGTALTP